LVQSAAAAADGEADVGPVPEGAFVAAPLLQAPAIEKTTRAAAPSRALRR
jgi:hypothetical protein